jgi:1-acyl-sn-glycerol-3-phosphate acyltransferase
MLRLIFVITVNFFAIIRYVPVMARYSRNPDKYTQSDRYALARRLMRRFKRTARIDTEYFGRENLPRDEGYIMFANHQGRYDGIGIMSGHERPCAVLIDKRRYCLPIIRQFAELIGAQSIDKRNARDHICALRAIATAVKGGKPFLIFPEGTYKKGQGNQTRPFKRGCFIMAQRVGCPIVPVALIDSYKAFEGNSLHRVRNQVVFLEPIPYEQYKDMGAVELAALVKSRIDAEIEKRTK